MATLRIDLDRSSPVPLYHQVAQALQRAIDTGDLAPGTFIENEVAMATRLGISRPTARQALQELVDRGQLVRRRGIGTQVAPTRVRRPVELTSLHDDLAKDGRDPSTRVLDHGPGTADAEVAAALEVSEGSGIVVVRRLRLADGEPLAVLTNHLRPDLAPTRAELEADGLYACLRSRGARPRIARQRIGARLATTAEARILEEPPRSAVLTMERTAYDESGGVIEHGRHVYRASRYLFDTTLFAR